MHEVEALAALTHIPHLGSIKIRLLVRHFGTARAALEADPAALAELPGFGPTVIAAFSDAKRSKPWSQSLDLADRQGVSLIPCNDPAYPKGLRELADYPVLLYVKGELRPQDVNSIAVVGTRQATVYGKEMAHQLSRQLALMGYTIASGLARGIDTQAHVAALQAPGRTLAVIGSGLADIYPEENAALASQIALQGALISEFPMLTPPDRQNFPQRNRLVAALSRATLLIEAPVKSGAMITVQRAIALKRPIFVLPGRVDVENFRGNHALIKSGQGRLVESAEDVAAALNDLFSPTHCAVNVPKPTIALEPEELQLLNAMPSEERSVDELLQDTKLPITKLNVLLMSLTLKKAIKEFPGKMFKKLSEVSRSHS